MNKFNATYCPNCFSDSKAQPCADCGWQAGQDNPPPALALGRVLDGRYRIGRVLGHGGFGITYLAWDDNLQLRLAIKEYLPRDCATRAPDGTSLAIYSGPAGEQFNYGLDRFLEEARALAHFDQHPGIVTVKNFFRAHGTGYCVMDYVDGITLREYLELKPGNRISFDDALKLLMPVMDALRAVHKEGLLHRDIAPDNIYLTQDGRIKLLDFGAARFAAGEHSRSLSVILKPGYAPEEQYRTKGHQGPWTDVYGLAATFYRAITGQVPPEALDRLDTDELVPPSRLGLAVTPDQEVALLRGMAVKARERYQSMAELQQAWRSGGHSTQPSQDYQDKFNKGPKVAAQPPSPSIRRNTGRILMFAGGMILLILAGIGFLQILKMGTYESSSTVAASTPALPPTPTTATTPQPAAPTIASASTQEFAPRPPTSENKADTVTEGERAIEQGDYVRAHLIFKPLAEAGDAMAQFYLGKMYHLGWGIEKNEAIGAKWYRKAAENGNAKAQNNLGFMYMNGHGVAKDEAEAARLYRKSAEQGLPQGQISLGLNYINGQGVIKDEAEAVNWFRRAADQGFPPGQVLLGAAYQLGRGVNKDEAEAVRWLRKGAEQGDAKGQVALGNAYAVGQGVAKDETEAVRWFRKAAEQGNTDAQFKLGTMFLDGQGVAKDAAEGVRWYRMAAEQGDTDAQFVLGVSYTYGQGVAKDAAEGVRWYRMAAEQGDAYAKLGLGASYANGQGVTKDEIEAVRWYRKAADQGNAEAQANLGLMYEFGKGVTKDEAEAVGWYRKAAEQGYAYAQFYLGKMYENGKGITKNKKEAINWYRKAAQEDHAEAKAALKRLGK